MLSSDEIVSFTKLEIHSDFMMLRLLSSFNEARRSQLYIAFTMMSVKKKSCGDQSLISAVGLVSCSGLNTSNWELLALSDGPVHFTWSGECSFQLHMLATEKFLSITHATENSFVVLTKQIREVCSIS